MRIGLGGGSRVARGGVSVGRGGFRGGLGLGPFNISGGSRGKGNDGSWLWNLMVLGIYVLIGLVLFFSAIAIISTILLGCCFLAGSIFLHLNRNLEPQPQDSDLFGNKTKSQRTGLGLTVLGAIGVLLLIWRDALTKAWNDFLYVQGDSWLNLLRSHVELSLWLATLGFLLSLPLHWLFFKSHGERNNAKWRYLVLATTTIIGLSISSFALTINHGIQNGPKGIFGIERSISITIFLFILGCAITFSAILLRKEVDKTQKAFLNSFAKLERSKFLSSETTKGLTKVDLVTGSLISLGSVLPWEAFGSFSYNGLDFRTLSSGFGDGMITALLGLAIVFLSISQIRETASSKWKTLLKVLLAVFSCILSTRALGTILGDTGFGLWITVISSYLCGVTNIWKSLATK